jgi:hypothetical protein
MSCTSSVLWSWEQCRDRLRNLRGRLGFHEKYALEFLGLSVDLADGSVMDMLTGENIYGNDSWSRFVTQAIYFVLSGYSESEHHEVTGRLVTSKQFSGALFGDLDNSRTRQRIVEEFSDDLSALKMCAERLGGREIEFAYGDIAMKLEALPLIPITIVLSVEDEEFQADARIFYDETIQKYLDAERTNFLTILTVGRLTAARTQTSKMNIGN